MLTIFAIKRKTKRLLVSASGPLTFTFLAVGITALGQIFTDEHAQAAADHAALFRLIYIALGVGAAFWLLQTYFEYRRRTHDPTWVLKFQDSWEAHLHERSKAAKVLLEFKDRLSKIETLESQLDPI